MTLIIEQIDVPERGEVDVNVKRSFTINITAEEAQRTVGRWLLTEVSVLLATDPPTLVLGNRILWRVPVWIGFPNHGRAGIVGTVTVDVESGDMVDIDASKAEIEQQADRFAMHAPPHKPLHVLSTAYMPDSVATAPSLPISDET